MLYTVISEVTAMPEISGSMEIEIARTGGASFKVRLGNEQLSFATPERPQPNDPLPFELFVRLRDWRRQRKASRWFELRVCDELCELPWAAALQTVLDDDPIVWRVPGQVARGGDPIPLDALRLLLSVWIDPSIPGLKKEIDGLAVLGDRGIHAAVALSPTHDHLRTRLQTEAPAILHLAPSGASEQTGALLYRDEVSGELQEVLLKSLVSWLPPELRLVVINTCHATAMAREITRSRGIMTITWANLVSDERALAFALFFYEQLLRGTSPADAILMFSNQLTSSDDAHRDIVVADSAPSVRALVLNPIIFVSDRTDLGLELIATAGSTRAASPRGRGSPLEAPVSRDGRGMEVSSLVRGIAPLHVDVRDAINPALLINGRETLKAIRVMSEHAISRAVVEVTCDAGVGISQVRRMVDLVAGVTSISTSDFQFPVLYELMRLGVKRRPINFRVRLLANDSELADETTSSWWMAQDEWIDSSDTHAFLPAFIDPDCQTAKEVWQSANERIMLFAGTTSLDGEAASERASVEPYVKSLYMTLRDRKLKYIQPPPQRIGVRGQRLAGQRVRSPEEVLKDGRGTCHDLALLFAACMEHIRLYPIVILIPGHTFAGYWRSSAAHNDYWRSGTRWQIHHKPDLRKLVTEDKVRLLEATSVTNPDDVSFEDACKLGSDHLEKTPRLDAAVDVRASRGFVDTLQ